MSSFSASSTRKKAKGEEKKYQAAEKKETDIDYVVDLHALLLRYVHTRNMYYT